VYCIVFIIFTYKKNVNTIDRQGRIQNFKLGGVALKKIAPSGGRRKIFWGISCEKSRFYAKKSYFFQLNLGLRSIEIGTKYLLCMNDFNIKIFIFIAYQNKNHTFLHVTFTIPWYRLECWYRPVQRPCIDWYYWYINA
jgi:hypothetical protein